MATIKVTLTPASPTEQPKDMVLRGAEPGTVSQTNGWTTFTGTITRRALASFPPGAIRCWEVLGDDDQITIAGSIADALVKG